MGCTQCTATYPTCSNMLVRVCLSSTAHWNTSTSRCSEGITISCLDRLCRLLSTLSVKHSFCKGELLALVTKKPCEENQLCFQSWRKLIGILIMYMHECKGFACQQDARVMSFLLLKSAEGKKQLFNFLFPWEAQGSASVVVWCRQLCRH